MRLDDFRKLIVVMMLLCTGWLFAGQTAFAEPVDLSKDPIPAKKLTFKDDGKLDGQTIRFEGVATPEAKRYVIDGLDVMRPFSFTILAKSVDKPVTAGLHRWFWKEADAAGSTGRSGDWNFTGRLHKEVGIEITAPESSPFYVLVWQGDAVAGQQVSLIQSASALGKTPRSNGEAQSGNGGTSPVMMIIMAALVGIFVLLGILVFRKGKGRTAAVLIFGMFLTTSMLALPGSAIAQDKPKPPVPTETPGDKPDPPETTSGDDKREVPGDKKDLPVSESGDDKREIPGDKKDPPQDTGGDDKGEVPGDKKDPPGAEPDSGDDKGEVPGDKPDTFDSRLAEAERKIVDLNGKIAENSREIAQLRFLLEQDRGNVPDPAPGGATPMPSNCLDGSECASCVSTAATNMTELLRDYERLRVIYRDTKDFSDRMVQLGDSVSGFHQLEQAAWYQEKLKITKSVDQMSNAYDAKLAQFNSELEGALREIDRCEAQGGQSGWYNQYGQLFYLTLTSHYRRKG